VQAARWSWAVTPRDPRVAGGAARAGFDGHD
jgi:hypothetical protein